MHKYPTSLPDSASKKSNHTWVGRVTARLRLWQFYWEKSDFFFIPLSETEYGWQLAGSIQFELPGYSDLCKLYRVHKIKVKTNCLVKLPCLLNFQGNIQRNTKRPEHFRNWKKQSAPVATDCNLKNLWCMPFKAAGPGQLHNFMQRTTFESWLLLPTCFNRLFMIFITLHT